METDHLYILRFKKFVFYCFIYPGFTIRLEAFCRCDPAIITISRRFFVAEFTINFINKKC